MPVAEKHTKGTHQHCKRPAHVVVFRRRACRDCEGYRSTTRRMRNAFQCCGTGFESWGSFCPVCLDVDANGHDELRCSILVVGPVATEGVRVSSTGTGVARYRAENITFFHVNSTKQQQQQQPAFDAAVVLTW